VHAGKNVDHPHVVNSPHRAKALRVERGSISEIIAHERENVVYRGASLVRKRTPPRTYRRPLWGPERALFLMKEVPLHRGDVFSN